MSNAEIFASWTDQQIIDLHSQKIEFVIAVSDMDPEVREIVGPKGEVSFGERARNAVGYARVMHEVMEARGILHKAKWETPAMFFGRF